MKLLLILLASMVYGLFSFASPAFAQLDFSTEELKRRALPAGASIPADKDKSEGGCFWQKVLVQGAPPCEEPNIVERFFGFLKEKFIGEQGFLNFIKPASQPSFFVQKEKQKEEEAVRTSIGLASEQLRLSLYPAGQAPSPQSIAQTGTPGLVSSDIKSLFQQVSGPACVPQPMLMAIAENETGTGGLLTFSKEEVKKFSTPDWWGVGASEEDLERGHCYNTCERSSVDICPDLPQGKKDVQGVMQFSIGAWEGRLPQIKQVLQRNFGASATYEPNRCNLRDVVVASALKMKGDSETAQDQCTTWSEKIVRDVANRYFGGCIVNKGTPDAWNYCDKAWENYQKYSTQP